jgi:hypothetical protein
VISQGEYSSEVKQRTLTTSDTAHSAGRTNSKTAPSDLRAQVVRDEETRARLVLLGG